MKKWNKGMGALVLLLVMVLAFGHTVFALTPMDNFYVNDYVGVLSEDQAKDMFDKSDFLSTENGVQVVTVVVKNFTGDSIASYANKVFNEFGIGASKDNNGLLLLVAIDDGEVWIETGTGMEAYLSDSQAGTLLDDYFIPLAAEGDFGQALYNTHMQLISVGSKATTEGVPLTTSQKQGATSNGAVRPSTVTGVPNQRARTSPMPNLVLMLFFVFLIIVLSGRRARRIRGGYGPTFVVNPFGRRRHTGFWGGHYHGHHHDAPPPSAGGWGTRNGGGGQSSGGGAGRSFGSGPNRPSGGSFGGGGGRSFGGGSFGGRSGGGGSSSGGGAGRKF